MVVMTETQLGGISVGKTRLIYAVGDDLTYKDLFIPLSSPLLDPGPGEESPHIFGSGKSVDPMLRSADLVVFRESHSLRMAYPLTIGTMAPTKRCK